LHQHAGPAEGARSSRASFFSLPLTPFPSAPNLRFEPGSQTPAPGAKPFPAFLFCAGAERILRTRPTVASLSAIDHFSFSGFRLSQASFTSRAFVDRSNFTPPPTSCLSGHHPRCPLERLSFHFCFPQPVLMRCPNLVSLPQSGYGASSAQSSKLSVFSLFFFLRCDLSPDKSNQCLVLPCFPDVLVNHPGRAIRYEGACASLTKTPAAYS